MHKWRIGELSTGLHSRKEVVALAQSFLHTEFFFDAVGDLLKRVDVVFNIRPKSDEDFLSFLERPPHGNEVFHITNRLEVLFLAWLLASDFNPAVASFNVDTLQKLKAEIRLVNRDAINAACDGDAFQKVKAATKSRRDITDAFYRVNRELGIHRAKHELAGRIDETNGKTRKRKPSKLNEQRFQFYLDQTTETPGITISEVVNRWNAKHKQDVDDSAFSNSLSRARKARKDAETSRITITNNHM